ncbi:hypothetical protein BDK51DRAFT_36808 [Blyttiomyces helicus]|uniref:Condensation domain-containing protein n=1 Tax=Blyttiomyces helicus TaxID=388810 RepID=A0A4P9WJJ6_9FUNG|nr:hypothetical protein BDK51DRAFT_36808 [Blyttiomyces helicus]|eukprot:RKO93109.1 hypothetical protein BDK51DRAFT_36808 [Blyttiomyces helicus]
MLWKYQKKPVSRPARLQKELDDPQMLASDRSSLWKVTLYPAPVSGAYLAVSIDHALSDGVGARNLAAELLALLVTCSEPNEEAGTFPPTPEETIAFHALPKDAHDDDPASHSEAIWPNPTLRPLADCTPCTKSFTLPPDLIASLHSVARQHGVATLHPAIHTAALSALALAVPPTANPLALSTECPVSLRAADRAHPRATGNYLCNLFFRSKSRAQTVSGLMPARSHVCWSTLRAAPRPWPPSLNSLASVPDPDPSPWPDHTGWEEKMMAGYAPDASRVRAPLGMSNVGVADVGPANGVRTLWFAQSPIAVSAWAICFSVESLDNGPTTFTINYRQGAIAGGDKFLDNLEAICRALSEGRVADDAPISTMWATGRGGQGLLVANSITSGAITSWATNCSVKVKIKLERAASNDLTEGLFLAGLTRRDADVSGEGASPPPGGSSYVADLAWGQDASGLESDADPNCPFAGLKMPWYSTTIEEASGSQLVVAT